MYRHMHKSKGDNFKITKERERGERRERERRKRNEKNEIDKSAEEWG